MVMYSIPENYQSFDNLQDIFGGSISVLIYLALLQEKEKLDRNSTKITRGIVGMMIHDFQPYLFC